MPEFRTLEDKKNYVLKWLPIVLEHDPSFVTVVGQIVLKQCPDRTMYPRLLEVMKRFEPRNDFKLADENTERDDNSGGAS